MTILVGICDDQAIVRDGLRVQLALAGDLAVVGEAPPTESRHWPWRDARVPTCS